MATELDNFWSYLKSKYSPDCEAQKYLTSRGHEFERLSKHFQLGFLPSKYFFKFEKGSHLGKFVWRWQKEGMGPAAVYPLRSLGGLVWGLMFSQCKRSSIRLYTLPEATSQALFCYTDSFDWARFHAEGSCVLVEGALDALSLSYHCPTVLSTVRAFTTRPQFRVLKRWCTTVYDCLDSDATGREAGSILARNLHTVPLALPLKDPQELHERGILAEWAREKLPISMRR